MQVLNDLAQLTDKKTGIIRGLYKSDADNKMISITCGELRRINATLRESHATIAEFCKETAS